MWVVHVLALLIVVAITGGSKFTLNVPQVLLPLVPSSGVRANFTLKAKQGCFVWCASYGVVQYIVHVLQD